MSDSVSQFYDDLAADYHLIFRDWQAAIAWNGELINALIRRQLASQERLSLLDCSCGIGTQALGLAAYDYVVTASDISPVSVERAAREAQARGLAIDFRVADFRSLAQTFDQPFDVVISFDNALPHLLTDAELQTAIHNMWAVLKPGGLLAISMRDYDALLLERPTTMPLRVNGEGQDRRIVFQVWDWQPDSDIYAINHFIVRQISGGESGIEWETRHQLTRYRALQRETVSAALAKQGFVGVQWHMPDDSSYYQPIVTAHRAG